MTWSENLDEETPAYSIASTTNSRLRVLAGPGTGKSFAMKRRVARLLEEGVDPAKILPVTFTRVAAEDLHRELVAMDTPRADELKATTLHSLALKHLSRNHVLQATGRTPRPLNDFELDPIYSDLASFGGKREIEKKIGAYHAAWARLQDDDPARVEDHRDLEFEQALVSWLIFHRGMLIGEVIPYFFQYLHHNPVAEERCEFEHILVDEFQDLNKVEQEIVKMLSDEADVCVVGDDDQSVYSFKFAHPAGIQDWCDDNPNADDLELTDCRRCPALVVQIANHLIDQSPIRTSDRELEEWADNGQGDVQIIQYPDLDREIQGIGDLVERLMGAGTHPGNIIVLCQRKKVGTLIYEHLKGRELPTKSYYAEAEIDYEETQRRFAQLKLAADPDDRVALRWLLGRNSANNLTGGYRRIRATAEQSNLTPWQVLEALADGEITLPFTNPLINKFSEICEELEAIRAILEESNLLGIVNHLFPEDDDRWEDLRDVALNVLDAEFDGVDDPDLRDFVAALSYAIAQPEIPSEIQDIRVMSLHKSKGLSAPVTIIASCVEGVIPRQPEDDLTDQEKLEKIEEQRRLFFVGVTRVKAEPAEGEPGRLYLTYSRRMDSGVARRAGIDPARFEYGEAVLNASRFLRDLGPTAPNPVRG